MSCKHGEAAIVCGSCDLELVETEEKKARLRKLDQAIAEGNLYDDPPSVMESLWEERDKLRSELGAS